MLKRKSLIICIACCVVAALLIGGNAYFDAGRGRTYGYQSWIEVTAQRLDNGSFFLTVDSEKETPALGDQAVERTIALINEGQTLDVDVLTGATISSSAALESATKALKHLGYDIDTLATRPSLTFEPQRLEKCDVVIIGAGGAGLTAAIEAAKYGADVVVVEKLGIAGGSTARSDGLIMATGSALQTYYGVNDTTASFAGFLYGFASENILQSRLIALAENSGANIDFLRENGVNFSESLIKTGGAESVERIHQITTSGGEAAGGALITPLRETAESLGVRFFYGADVNEILTDHYSNIIGVTARCLDGSELTVHAAATVIASGGYDRSPSLIREFSLGGQAPAFSYSGAGNTGDVTRLASDLGVKIIKGSLIAELRDFAAGTDSAGALLVNDLGSRFADESLDAFSLGSAVQSSGSGTAWLILDSAKASGKVEKLAGGESGVVSAAGLEELALKLGAANLPATVSRYNYMCVSNLDEDYGKPTRWLKEISDNGPYYAVPYKLASYGSLGGIRTNNRCQAMSNLAAVPGLYAAGEAAFGSYMDEGYPGFGASLAVVVDSGRIAGKNAAVYALTGAIN